MQQFAPDDRRPSEILRLVGTGATGKDAAAKIGISRKTVTRWRERIPGFGRAYDQVARLSRNSSPIARAQIELIVAAWTPGGLVEPELETVFGPEPEPAVDPKVDPEADPMEREPEWVRERALSVIDGEDPELGQKPEPAAGPSVDPSPQRRHVVEPDVLDSTGSEVTVQGSRPAHPQAAPYTKVRPPTRDEWLAEMAALAKDPKQPERVRVTAIAAVSSGLFGGPGGRSTRPADLDDAAVAAAAQVRGRDPGVPASVWQEARRNFLGPAPGEEDDEGIVQDQDARRPEPASRSSA